MRAAAVALAILFSPSLAFAYGEGQGGFPNWGERVLHAWMNRARCDPQVEMQACGGSCPEGSCYAPTAPLGWNESLNRAARFHSDEMAQQGYFAHDSACTVVSNIDALYPGSCDGAASCACEGGVAGCNPTCTAWNQRVALFGESPSGEIIASPSDPDGAFYLWLFEAYDKTACGYDQGPPTNGHRWNILMGGPSVGAGLGAGPAVGDFGGAATGEKIPSGSHYPQQAASVEAWANWYDGAGPSEALIDVDGSCSPMSLARGAVTNGAYLATVTGVSTGCHRYFFAFKDSGGAVVTYPTTGSLGIGPSATCADWDSSRPPLGAGCNCTPACGDHVCGDNGCGGECGSCPASTTCAAGQCVAYPADPAVDATSSGGSCGCRLAPRASAPGMIALGLALALGLARRRAHARVTGGHPGGKVSSWSR